MKAVVVYGEILWRPWPFSPRKAKSNRHSSHHLFHDNTHQGDQEQHHPEPRKVPGKKPLQSDAWDLVRRLACGSQAGLLGLTFFRAGDRPCADTFGGRRKPLIAIPGIR